MQRQKKTVHHLVGQISPKNCDRKDQAGAREQRSQQQI